MANFVNDSIKTAQSSLSNFPANASLGIAVATVDKFSSFLIPQTTAGITLTLPNPTDTTAGDRVTVLNVGTVNFVLSSQVVAPNTALDLAWSGSAWIPRQQPPTGASNGLVLLPASRAINLDDYGKTVLATVSGLNVTVNTGLPSYFIFRLRKGPGVGGGLSVAAGAGMTLFGGPNVGGGVGSYSLVEVNGTQIYMS